MLELAIVHDGQSDERQSHSKEIEEKWGDVLKCALHEDEGCTPDEHDRQKQEVSQDRGAESMGQLVVRSDGRFGGWV